MLSGLSQINVEVTNFCDKKHICQMCGHQNPKIVGQVEHGYMAWGLFTNIIDQLPADVVLQLHKDGEPTAYPRFGDVLEYCRRQIVSIVTHGLNLVRLAPAIIGNCTTVTVSAFHNDLDAAEQIEILKEFLEMKGDRAPMVNVKIVGYMPPERRRQYECLGVPVLNRLIHVPSGDTRYAGGRRPTIPEHGICSDFLSHPSVDWKGRLYQCNRLDPADNGLLGDLNEHSLDELWNSPKRMAWLEQHKRGRRDLASPLCKDCLFYGIPTGAD